MSGTHIILPSAVVFRVRHYLLAQVAFLIFNNSVAG